MRAFTFVVLVVALLFQLTAVDMQPINTLNNSSSGEIVAYDITGKLDSDIVQLNEKSSVRCRTLRV